MVIYLVLFTLIVGYAQGISFEVPNKCPTEIDGCYTKHSEEYMREFVVDREWRIKSANYILDAYTYCFVSRLDYDCQTGTYTWWTWTYYYDDCDNETITETFVTVLWSTEYNTFTYTTETGAIYVLLLNILRDDTFILYTCVAGSDAYGSNDQYSIYAVNEDWYQCNLLFNKELAYVCFLELGTSQSYIASDYYCGPNPNYYENSERYNLLEIVRNLCIKNTGVECEEEYDVYEKELVEEDEDCVC